MPISKALILYLLIVMLAAGRLCFNLWRRKGRWAENVFWFSFLAACVLYRKYLIGEVYFLYAVVDGYSQYLPNYVRFVRDFVSNHWPTLWNFSQGFGAPQYYDVLAYPINALCVLSGVLLGERGMLLCYAWLHVIKIALSALFAYLFVQELGMKKVPSVYVALIYSLNGILILRGFWVYLADEAYIAMLMLWAAERYFRNKDWRLIPLAAFLLGSALGVYYIYLYGLLLMIYAAVRFRWSKGSLHGFAPFILICGGLFAAGILMSTISLASFRSTVLSTARFQDTMGYTQAVSLFSTTNPSTIVSGILSSLEPNLLGIFDQYTGSQNYLERPIFYAGMLCFFLIPQALVLGKEHRKLMLLGLGLAALYLISPAIQDVLNMFVRNEEIGQRSFRLASQWVMILMVMIAGFGLQLSMDRGVNVKCLFMTTIALISVLLTTGMAAPAFSITIQPVVLVRTVLMILFWGSFLLLFTDGTVPSRERVTALVLCAFAEVGICAACTIGGSVKTADENMRMMRGDPFGYYGSMNEAVRYIKENDPDLYRVGGNHPSAGAAAFCSPLYFDVYDSSYYNNIDAYTYQFLSEMSPESFTNGIGKKYSAGVSNDLIVSTLTGYKYMILEDSDAEIYGYTKVKSFGDVHVYKNDYYVPIVYANSKFLPRSEFETLSPDQKKWAMMYFLVLEDDAQLDTSLLEKATPEELNQVLKGKGYDIAATQYQKNGLVLEQWSETCLAGVLTADADAVMTMNIPYNTNWHIYMDGVEQSTLHTNIGFMGVAVSKGTHQIRIEYKMPIFYVCAAISLLCMIVYCAVVLVDTKKRKKRIESVHSGTVDSNEM